MGKVREFARATWWCAVGVFASLAAVVPARGQQDVSDVPRRSIAIHAAALIDVERGRSIPNALVIVSGRRIRYAGPRSGAQVPADAEQVTLSGATLLPGLIDAHVHLTLGGTPAANARATLDAGFTTVQDLGAADGSNLALRDDIAAGRTLGPDVVAAGRWIGITGGTCDFNGIGVRGAAAFRERVAEEISRGADVIKVCVSGWLADARRDQKQYEISDQELAAAVEEAHKRGRRVAVHALSAGAVAASVRMGADLLVHGGFVPVDAIDAMKSRGAWLLPTLYSLGRAAAREDVADLESHLRMAVRAGLPVAFGTDAGVIPHGTNAREFEFLRRIGLTPADALRAATIHAAAAVGLQNRAGVLAPGAEADVIATTGNPLEDMKSLERVVFVMSNGVVVTVPSSHKPK